MKLELNEKYYIHLIGAIGSGKSTFVKELQKSHPEVFIINKDEIFESNKNLPKRKLFKLAFDKTEKIKANLFRSKTLILEETTGKDINSVRWSLKQANDLGFKTILLLKNTELNECFNRARKRKIRPIVNKELISDTFIKSNQTFIDLKEIVDQFEKV